MKTIILLLLLVTPVFAGIKTGRSGVFISCSTGCTNVSDSTDILHGVPPGPTVFIAQGTNNPIFELEQSADGVTFVTTALECDTSTGSPANTCRLQINNTVGYYRWIVSCTSCTYTMYWHQGPGSLW